MLRALKDESWTATPQRWAQDLIDIVDQHRREESSTYRLQAWFGNYSEPIEAMVCLPIPPQEGMQIEVYVAPGHPNDGGHTEFLEIDGVIAELHGGDTKLTISTDGHEREELQRTFRAVEIDEVAESEAYRREHGKRGYREHDGTLIDPGLTPVWNDEVGGFVGAHVTGTTTTSVD